MNSHVLSGTPWNRATTQQAYAGDAVDGDLPRYRQASAFGGDRTAQHYALGVCEWHGGDGAPVICDSGWPGREQRL